MTISREVLGKYITPGCTFVEAGCRWADTTIEAIRMGAGVAVACETDPLISAVAQMRVDELLRDRSEDVIVLNEESVYVLSEYMDPADSEVVVFLDAHTETSSPVLQELAAIAAWDHPPKTILIDDMRCMDAWGVHELNLVDAVTKIGNYGVSTEDGYAPKDIMVCQLKR